MIATHIDQVREPNSIFKFAQDCVDSAVCAGLLTVASDYYNLPLDKVVVSAAGLSGNKDGEGANMRLSLPPDYVYCKSEMRMTSIVPHDGPKGSTFFSQVEDNGIYLETWTPALPSGDGRSWVEADVSVLGVAQGLAEAKYADGTCVRPGGRYLFFCRGGGCVDTQDNGQSVDTTRPPGANSRNN